VTPATLKTRDKHSSLFVRGICDKEKVITTSNADVGDVGSSKCLYLQKQLFQMLQKKFGSNSNNKLQRFWLLYMPH